MQNLTLDILRRVVTHMTMANEDDTSDCECATILFFQESIGS